MEFKYNPNLDYQIEAINAVVDVFQGQQNITQSREFITEGQAIPNSCSLSDSEILDNIRDVQERQGLPLSDEIESINVDDVLDPRADLSIEMETGTGKTYVYLRTIYELYDKYGWKKFIIVVPSIAIKRGVLSALSDTHSHFQKLYGDTPVNHFEYDSQNLNRVKQFSHNNEIEVMVMTLQSINRPDDNVIFENYDTLSGKKPIEIIQDTNPVLILDEPQNMESKNSKEALSALNPLASLRYSATHRNSYNLINQLTPVDAYQRGLVKQIDVLSVTKEHDFNNTYIDVKEIDYDSDGPKAKLEIYKELKDGIKKGKKTVRYGDDLYRASKKVDTYRGITVTEIDSDLGFIEFSDGTRLYESESTDTDVKKIQHQQIRQTIREHFKKASEYHKKGIKILSLFFIDEVENYTGNDAHLREAFIEHFNDLKKEKRWKELYGDVEPTQVMGSYFSEYKTKSRIQEDTEAFELIMEEKRQLLSLDEPIQFIFSHSALQEGWDNPNVFNICTLNNTVSEVKKRQEIGRGVRLPVDQDGGRINDIDEALTVIANESYSDYVEALQTELEEDMNIDTDASERVKNRRDRSQIRPDQDVIENADFQTLWDKISPKTRYVTNIDTEDLVQSASNQLKNIRTENAKIEMTKAEVEMDKHDEGVEVESKSTRTKGVEIDTEDATIPNIVNELEEGTNLTRSTIADIILEADVLYEINKNPQEFLIEARRIINQVKNNHTVDNIEYSKTGNSYSTDILDTISTYTSKTVDVDKSVYEKVIYDSEGERKFAKRLDREDEIVLFIKLPSSYTIPTPSGEYNPDWGIVHQNKDLEGNPTDKPKLYLVRETKFVASEDSLRQTEKYRIKCAESHYDVLNVDFDDIYDVDEKITHKE